MSIFAFAHGVVGELNNIAREKAEKIRKEEDRADDFDYAVRLAREQGDIQLETKKKEINLLEDQTQEANLMSLLQYLGDDAAAALLQRPEIRTRVGKAIGVDLGAVTLANIVNETASNPYEFKGGSGMSLVVPRGDEDFTFKDYGIFDEGRMFWNDMNQFLSDDTNRRTFIDYFTDENNADAYEVLAGEVRKNESNVRLGWRAAQTRDNPDLPATEIQSYDLRGTHGIAVQVFEELGLSNAEDDIRNSLKSDLVFDEQTEDVLFLNVEGMTGSNAERQEAVVLPKTDIDALQLLAEQTGYKDAQDLALGFTFTGVYEPEEGETRGEAAMKQNSTLIAAARLNQKYGRHLRSQVPDPTQDRAFLQELAIASGGTMESGTITGANRNKMVNILAMLRPTPSGLFTQPKRNIFASNEKYVQRSNVRVAEFMAERSGIKKEEFQVGFNAQKDTLLLLDRLVELETVELAEATGTVRELIGFGKAVTEQLKQVGKAGAELLGVDTLLQDTIFSDNTKSGTDEGSLMGVVNKLRSEGVLDIDLADLSEADAIRLSLAAKMARAIDPAGRLSNQDFEIQLRRLGGSSLDTPAAIARKLKTVRAEFERDLVTKTYMNRLYETNAMITPGAARRIDAYFELRGFEGQMYGSGIPFRMETDTGEVVSNVAGEAGALTAKPDANVVQPTIIEDDVYNAGGFKGGIYVMGPNNVDVEYGYNTQTKTPGAVILGENGQREFVPFADFEKRGIVKKEAGTQANGGTGNTAN